MLGTGAVVPNECTTLRVSTGLIGRCGLRDVAGWIDNSPNIVSDRHLDPAAEWVQHHLEHLGTLPGTLAPSEVQNEERQDRTTPLQ